MTLLPRSPVPVARDAASAVVELKDVTVDFRAQLTISGRSRGPMVRAVDKVTFSVGKGETFGLVGESGSGKSTIGRLLFGMVRPTSGTLRVNGRDLVKLRGRDLAAHARSIQIVLQDPYASLDPRMTIASIIAEPITHGSVLKERSAKVRSRVRDLIRLVGLPEESLKLLPHQFSGGQRQRIAIARALASEPSVVVLDEPTSSLDVSVRAQILNLLKDLQSELGVTYLLISHDLGTVSYMADRIGVMYLGQVVEIGSVEQMSRAYSHPYTWLLMASAPGNKTIKSADVVAAGEIPGGQDRPSGCRFHPRCPLRRRLSAEDARRCSDIEPGLSPRAEPAHMVACHFADRSAELKL